MTQDMQRMARQMMGSSATAGTGEATPLVSPNTGEPRAIDPSLAPFLISATFMSRTGGDRPHVITRGIDGSVWCTCRASVPCWATKAFIAIVGM